jgi:hypothetical protein
LGDRPVVVKHQHTEPHHVCPPGAFGVLTCPCSRPPSCVASLLCEQTRSDHREGRPEKR